MYDLTKFTLEDMTRCGDALQAFGLKAKNLEELANLMVHYFYDNLTERQTGERSCVLVRFFYDVPSLKARPGITPIGKRNNRWAACPATNEMFDSVSHGGNTT